MKDSCSLRKVSTPTLHPRERKAESQNTSNLSSDIWKSLTSNKPVKGKCLSVLLFMVRSIQRHKVTGNNFQHRFRCWNCENPFSNYLKHLITRLVCHKRHQKLNYDIFIACYDRAKYLDSTKSVYDSSLSYQPKIHC